MRSDPRAAARLLPRLALLVLLAPLAPPLLLAGCERERLPPAALGSRDSAGIEIRIVGATAAVLALDAAPVLTIGGSADDPLYQFHQVVTAARLADGSIVVVDGGARSVRWYDERGAHRASAGRRGGGPGPRRCTSCCVASPTPWLCATSPRAVTSCTCGYPRQGRPCPSTWSCRSRRLPSLPSPASASSWSMPRAARSSSWISAAL